MHDAWRAAVAGAAAVWIMDRFDWFAFNHEDPKARYQTERVRPEGMDPAHALADKAASAAGKRLSSAPPHQHPAGLAVHYAVPMGLALLYEVLRRRTPAIMTGSGALYGISLFLILDEVINPMLGLAAAPGEYPWQRHAREMTAHAIFGMATHVFLNRVDDRKNKSSADLFD